MYSNSLRIAKGVQIVI